ncbi:IS630 family transposase (plasmid) [Deinococcus sp. KNUC1210]|uniref:IS630 family transposase n=1 Tax=Deinococcus sp. KNUC1210 TaxID=2917691 RepID=UPI001EF0FCEC|nr:IS630 family transposase [Deinococcus sp. KNUC1210]ULH14004.1 IS630 family transposase [Deinococcus sp. KNUC1210]
MAQAWQPAKLTRPQLEERRLFAEPYLREGAFSSAQLAELCGVESSTVRTWRQRLRTQGSLEATVTSGPPGRLTDAHLAELIGLLQAGPDPNQYPDQRWTCPRIRAVIGLKFDVWYHVDHLSRLLHAWGFSRQKPAKRAAEQDQDAVAAWIDTMAPELERKIETGETLAFLDEVGFSLKPTVARTWAPCGNPPVLKTKTNWQKVSTIGAITTTGQFLQHTHPAAIKGPHVIAFLTHLLRHVKGKVTVILDNASIHKTKALSAFVAGEMRLSMVYLPPYSPELNPIELVWAYVKQQMMGNFCPRDLVILKSRLFQAWRRVRYVQLPAHLLHGVIREQRTQISIGRRR